MRRGPQGVHVAHRSPNLLSELMSHLPASSSWFFSFPTVAQPPPKAHLHANHVISTSDSNEMAPVISENEACEGTSSIAAGVRDFDLNDGKATAFHRLLDLPREARDCIYRHALTYHLEEPAMYCPAPAFERPNVALLRCNKQINEEGSEVFAKCNRFVRVETPITYLVSGTKPKPVVWISGGECLQK